jgi:Bax protein
MFPVLLMTVLAGLAGCDQAQQTETQGKASENSTDAIPVSEKKARFWALLTPLIEKSNAEVLAEREALKVMQMDSDQLSASQLEKLQQLGEKYRVDDELAPKEQIKRLLVKVNTIPASLVLAQAANESAWGTSRFATEGNNFFGQWCFSKGCGLVPKSRNSGANHEVAKFDSPLDSVRSYIRNLNRHPTYKKLRELRLAAHQKGQLASGELLAEGLIGYSERREEYVKEIQSMIRYNKLSRFDKAKATKADNN